MAQIEAITGARLKKKQTDEMLARLGLLPELLAQQEQRKFQEAQISNMEKEQGIASQRLGLEERNLGFQQKLAQKQSDLQTETEQKEMGVRAGGMGFSLLSGNLGKGMTFGDIPSKLGMSAPSTHPQGSLLNTPIVPTIGGGIMGFAGGQLLGGKSKLKKSAIGAGIGGIAGYLGSNGDLGSTLGAGFLGGLGGLF